MVSRGADVSDDEIDTLVEYLAENFGPTKGPTTTRKNHVRTHVVNVNKATATELAGALNLTAKDAAAIVAYRDQNGSFKAWTDLTKVPVLKQQRFRAIKPGFRSDCGSRPGRNPDCVAERGGFEPSVPVPSVPLRPDVSVTYWELILERGATKKRNGLP
jgi:competence ComEA-like helix-hairpin-helix protein